MKNVTLPRYTIGPDALNDLERVVSAYGRKVALIHGAKAYAACQALLTPALGSLDVVREVCYGQEATYENVARLTEDPDVRRADVLIGIGGGSTLDCSKAICAGVPYAGDPWELVLDRTKVQDCLPLITVLTMAATGSEMDNIAVISNPETKDKRGFSSYGMYPRFSILDPVYTFTVPRSQTAAGTADIMSHIMESYFDQVRGASVQDGLSEALLKTCIQSAPVALAHPDDYEARANLMWAASLAINGLNSLGKNRAWTCHPLEHVLSAYYDITHGVGLAILTPRWMKHVLNEQTVDVFARFALNVWSVDPQLDCWTAAQQGIEKLSEFFASMGLPMTLREVGIDESRLEEMAEKAAETDFSRAFVPLTREDILQIYRACL